MKRLLASLLILLCACEARIQYSSKPITQQTNRKYSPGDFVLLVTGEKGMIQNVSATTGYQGTPAYYVRLTNTIKVSPESPYDLSIRIYEFEISNVITN